IRKSWTHPFILSAPAYTLRRLHLRFIELDRRQINFVALVRGDLAAKNNGNQQVAIAHGIHRNSAKLVHAHQLCWRNRFVHTVNPDSPKGPVVAVSAIVDGADYTIRIGGAKHDL